MNRAVLVLCCTGVLAAATEHPTSAQGKGDWRFQRVGTFTNYRNGTIDELTVSEIIASTTDGKTLVFTDAERAPSASSTSQTHRSHARRAR